MARGLSGRMGTWGRNWEYQLSNMIVTLEPPTKRTLHGCPSVFTVVIWDGPTSPSGKPPNLEVSTEPFLIETTSLSSVELLCVSFSSLLFRRALSNFCITLGGSQGPCSV